MTPLSMFEVGIPTVKISAMLKLPLKEVYREIGRAVDHRVRCGYWSVTDACRAEMGE
jgi:hypothetical protein